MSSETSLFWKDYIFYSCYIVRVVPVLLSLTMVDKALWKLLLASSVLSTTLILDHLSLSSFIQ